LTPGSGVSRGCARHYTSAADTDTLATGLETRVTDQTNDRQTLTPITCHSGPKLELDFPGLEIGVAEYAEGPTGCTVFHFPAGAMLAVDVRGGSPAWIGDYGWTNAVCLAGGSLHGLEAISGVVAELFAQHDYKTGWDELALASGAIIYDYRPRDNAIYPDKALGRAALAAAKPGTFPLGAHGAGCSATVGKGILGLGFEPSGQGGAFHASGEDRVAFFTVVNAVGAVVDRAGNVVRGHLDAATGDRQHAGEAVSARAGGEPVPGNTTISLLVTNRTLDARSLTQLGRQVHTSMARAIHPFHAPTDGDVLFTVSTGAIDDDALNPYTLGIIASELAWDAVLSAVTS
jgi:L-aminopeptidase/D-esterase-like protein